MDTWIFLRGLTRESIHWGDFPSVFAQAMPAVRIVTPDLPGNGQLYQQRSPCSIGTLVEHCRGALAQQGVKPPFNVLAMSMGAMVATQWAYQNPAELGACVLINTSFRPFNATYHRLRPGNYGALLRMAILPASAVQRERSVLQLTSNRVAEHAAVLADWTHARQQRPVSTANALRQLLAAARFTARPQPPAARLLLLGSAHDRLVNIACSQAIAHHWQCPLILHPSAGHDLPLDDPAWVAARVREWLTEP